MTWAQGPPPQAETPQHRELRDAIWADLAEWRAYVIGVDGLPAAGKSTLARYLAWQLGMPAIETDTFLELHSGPHAHRVPELGQVIRTRLELKRPVIVEGLLLLSSLERLSVTPDFLVYVDHRECDPGPSLAEYLESYEQQYQPRDRARFVFKRSEGAGGGSPARELDISESVGCAELVRDTGSPDERCLEAAVVHVAHDLELLQHAWESRRLRVGWTLWFITARALMDFFFRRDRKKDRDGKYQDDILASDYLGAGAWQSVAKGLTPPESYDQVREAANKLSAHLTYSRVDLREEGGIPPSAAVHEFLLGTAAVWLEKLEPRRRVWFGRGLPSGSD